MFKVIVDSGCDLKTLDHVSKEIPFARVPLKIIVGTDEYVDTVDLDTEHMMKEVYAYKGKTGTACPSPEDWAAQFRSADESYVIPISKGMSGSYNCAQVAREMVMEEFPEKKIHIFDCKTAGAEMTLLAEKIGKLALSGLPFEMVCSEAERYLQRTDLFYLLNSLENFAKNGRVSKAAGMTAKLLNIKILGAPSPDGDLDLMHKCRGKSRAFHTIMTELKNRGFNGERAIIGHTNNPAEAEELKRLVLSEYPNARITVMLHSGLCSFYSEQNGLLIAFEKEPKGEAK